MLEYRKKKRLISIIERGNLIFFAIFRGRFIWILLEFLFLYPGRSWWRRKLKLCNTGVIFSPLMGCKKSVCVFKYSHTSTYMSHLLSEFYQIRTPPAFSDTIIWNFRNDIFCLGVKSAKKTDSRDYMLRDISNQSPWLAQYFFDI